MKRKRKNHEAAVSNKRVRITSSSRAPPTVALLSQYYSRVSTLRAYLCSQLSGSKRRVRAVAQYGRNNRGFAHPDSVDHDIGVARLLDTTLVGVSGTAQTEDFENVDKEIATYTQQISEDSTIEISATQGALQQSEVGGGVVLSYLILHTSFLVTWTY